MLVFRSFLFALYMVVTVIPFALLSLAMAPLPLHWRYRITVLYPRGVIHAARILCGIRWQIKGWENLPSGQAIVLSKHQSAWETCFLIAWLPRDLCFVFKRELLYLPFFGWGLWLLNMIHIDRRKGSDAFESVVTQGEEQLARGRWIIMFPEGARIAVGKQGKYKLGGPKLAVRTNTQVVPIAHNAGECWPRNAFIKRPGLITVSIGPAIQTDGKPASQVSSEVESWIEGEMRVISPERYAVSPAPSSLPVGVTQS